MATSRDPATELADGRRLPFCQVDNALISDPSLDPYAKLVYVLLCGYASLKTMDCFPSHERICADLAVSKPTVIKALKILSDKGVLEVVKRRQKGRAQSNAYIIKDWRSGSPATTNQVNQVYSDVEVRVNNVDLDVGVRVNDVCEQGKPRLLGSSVDRVNDVYTNDIDRDLIKDNQVSQDAIAPEPPLQKPTKKSSSKSAKQTDPRIRQVIDAINEAYGEEYPEWKRHVVAIQGLLKRHPPEQIVGCWKDIYKQRGGDFIPLSWLVDRIKAWKDNGGNLPQKGNGNGRTNAHQKSARGQRHNSGYDFSGVTENLD